MKKTQFMKGGNESLFVSLSQREREREGLKRKGKIEEGKKERWIEWNGNCTLWHGVVKFINMALEIKVLKKMGRTTAKNKTKQNKKTTLV